MIFLWISAYLHTDKKSQLAKIVRMKSIFWPLLVKSKNVPSHLMFFSVPYIGVLDSHWRQTFQSIPSDKSHTNDHNLRLPHHLLCQFCHSKIMGGQLF